MKFAGGGALKRRKNMPSPKEAYQQATREAAAAHVRNLPWMAPYLNHPAVNDSTGYSVLGSVGRIVRECVPLLILNVTAIIALFSLILDEHELTEAYNMCKTLSVLY